MAQSSKPENDAVGFVQPSIEIMDRVIGLTRDAGTRPVRGLAGASTLLRERSVSISIFVVYHFTY